MMVFSFEKASCCVTLTLGILIGLGGRANAASIVQTVDYNFVPHGTTFGYYNQFNPSMGTLLDVMIQCQRNAYLYDVMFTNVTTVDQTFTGSVSFGLNTDGGSTSGSNSFTFTLPPPPFVFEGASTAYDLSTSYGNTSFWVGTGQLGPFQFAAQYLGAAGVISLAGQSDNPNISISTLYSYSVVTGVETVTYVYQPVGAVPEPPAYMMLGTGPVSYSWRFVFPSAPEFGPDWNRLGHAPSTGTDRGNEAPGTTWRVKSWPRIRDWDRGFSLARVFPYSRIPI